MSLKITVYLASQSPRRRYLIRRAGYRCRVIPSLYQEKHDSAATPRALVLRHARGKLRHAQVPAGARFVAAADTVVVLRGRVFGKPADLQAAETMLAKLSGREHRVYTGWALRDCKTGRAYYRVVTSRVKIRALTAVQIRNYFKKMNPLDKAGAYAVQSRPSVVDAIDGSYSNVMGLPMEDFQKILNQCQLRNFKKP